MGRTVVIFWEGDMAERRKILLRELDLHGGSPAAVARSFRVSVVTIQKWLERTGLRGEAKRARDRWVRMFTLGGKDRRG